MTTARVGVIGAGQLARMMIPYAVNLGIDIRVLAEGEGMSAGLAATQVGDYTDLDTVRRFASGVDVVTFDHEHVPQRVLRALEDDGVAVRPGADALRFAQDKADMRAKVAELGLPQPDWALATTAAEVDAFVGAHGGRAIVKTPRGGYDGHGVRIVSSGAEAADWLAPEALRQEGGRLLLEEFVDFRRELSQQIARTPSGEVAAYPLVETIQLHGVCSEAIAPLAGATEEQHAEAGRIARTIADAVGVTGMLAVELFEDGQGRILINELAMRPHNSGHWSMDGAVTGQFEQHLRAILDWPLGATDLRAPHAVMVNVLGGPAEDRLDGCLRAALASDPTVKVHWYQKSHRPHRKVGHVNAYGDDLDAVLAAARRAADLLDRDH